jgi:AcrR family transcriptional regulator
MAPDDTRTAILKAARKLIVERGFHGTPMPLLAEEAGVAVGSMYRYFPSKEALLQEAYLDAKR